MNDIVQFFDQAIVYVIGYPVTMFNVAFHPTALVASPLPALYCSPGLSLAISLTISYFVTRLGDRIFLPNDESEWGKWEMTHRTQLLQFLIVFIIAWLSMEWLVFTLVFRFRPIVEDTVSVIAILSYPISFALVLHSITYLLSIVFPRQLNWIGRKTLALADGSFSVYCRFFCRVAFGAGALWGTFGLLRVTFSTSVMPSIIATATVGILSLLIGVGAGLAFDRIESNVKTLSEREALLDTEDGTSVSEQIPSKSQEDKLE